MLISHVESLLQRAIGAITAHSSIASSSCVTQPVSLVHPILKVLLKRPLLNLLCHKQGIHHLFLASGGCVLAKS